MALFESYERRIDKINSVLNGYGISSRAYMVTSRLRKYSRFVLRTLAGRIR